MAKKTQDNMPEELSAEDLAQVSGGHGMWLGWEERARIGLAWRKGFYQELAERAAASDTPLGHARADALAEQARIYGERLDALRGDDDSGAPAANGAPGTHPQAGDGTTGGPTPTPVGPAGDAPVVPNAPVPSGVAPVVPNAPVVPAGNAPVASGTPVPVGEMPAAPGGPRGRG